MSGILRKVFYGLALVAVALAVLAIVGKASLDAALLTFGTPAVVFVLLGRYMARRGARSKRPAVVANASVLPAEPETIELPLTPAGRAAIIADRARKRRAYLWVSAILVVVMVGIASLVGLSRSAGIGATLTLIGWCFGLALPCLAFVWVFEYFTVERRASRDLAGGVFVRMNGAISTRQKEVSDGDSGRVTYYYLLVGARPIRTDREVFRAVDGSGVTYGTVDSAPSSGLVFEVRDAAGQVVFQRARYSAEAVQLAAA